MKTEKGFDHKPQPQPQPQYQHYRDQDAKNQYVAALVGNIEANL